MKKKKGRKLLDDLLSMFGQRTFYLALLFSLAAHGAVMVLLRDWPGAREKKNPAMIVARLIRLSETAPYQERDALGEKVNEEEEKGEEPVAGEERADSAPSGEGTVRGEAPPLGHHGFRGRAGMAAAAVGEVDAGRGRRVAGRFSPAPPVRATGTGVLSMERQAGGRAGRGGDVAAALAEIRRRVESKKRYPALARRKGWEGRVLVELRLGGKGELESLRLLQPSGFPLLDRATMRAVESAVPFPPLTGTVRIPVTYDLED